MKICSKCNVEKELTEEFYHTRIGTPSGFRGQCKECRNERERSIKRDRGLYPVWNAMIQRCYNAENRAYKHYGKRNITVCDRWKNSYEDFLSDIGERPSKNHSLDRIDNDGDYSPDNCKWSTWFEQALNRREQSNNTSSKTGVYWDKKNNNWRVEIQSNNKRIGLGSYIEFDEAVKTRKEAESKYHGKSDANG